MDTDIAEILKNTSKMAELYRPATTSFTDEVVVAAMKVIVDVIQNGTCENREVFESARIVLNVAMNPIELHENPIKWNYPT